MVNRKTRWIFVVDGRGGRLMRCSRVEPRDRCRVEEQAAITNALLPNDQKGKPDTTGVPGISYADPDRGHDAMRDQFASDVARWLEQQVAAMGISQLDLFAPPEFRGALRPALPDRLLETLCEHDGDLTWMTASDLSRHPAIAQLAGPPG